MEPLRFKIKKHRNNFTNRMIGIFLLTTLLCGLLSGCSSEPKKVSKEGFYFDTIITITLYGTDDEKYINGCFSLAKEYENKFSNTIAGSEISQINDADGKYVTVSDDTLELIQDGINYGKESDGKFDIAIGALSDLWNISEIAENSDSSDNEVDASVLPSNNDIKKSLAHIDYRSIEIKGNQVRLHDPDVKLDLGGIAKGYIADQMRSYLRDQGITEGVISLGGNVLTLGEKASDDNYAIGIQKPFAASGTSLGVIKVKDASVVSSGIYERYYRIGDKIYHHILDTTTGYPIENDLYQVTIISKSSMDGDALSTTCFALGLEEGMNLIENTKDTEAIFVTNDGKPHCSSGIGNTVIFEEN